jgi:hypothetical protein
LVVRRRHHRNGPVRHARVRRGRHLPRHGEHRRPGHRRAGPGRS